jgi:hypothetical protein
MSLEQVEHDFRFDQIEQENIYPATDVQYAFCECLNQGSFQGSQVRFGAQALVGANSSAVFDMANSYVSIPYTITAQVTNGKFQGATNNAITPENVFMLALKGAHHILDSAVLSWNGVSITRNTPRINLWLNELLKDYPLQTFQNLASELLVEQWDTSESLQYNGTTKLESNGNLLGSASGIAATGYAGANFVNQGHLARLRAQNIDLTQGDYYQFIGNSATGLLSGCFSHSISAIQWSGIVRIPLPFIHPIFSKMSLLSSLSGFSLILTLNIGQQNNYTINLNNGAQGVSGTANAFAPTVTSNQAFGNTCPILVSTPAYMSNTGFSVCATAASATVLITSAIGYQLAPGVFSGGSVSPRLYIKKVMLTPMYQQVYLKQGPKKILYNDIVQFTMQNVASGAQSYLISNVLPRLRTMYLIPFLSASNRAGNPPAYQSPLVSHPNTCSKMQISQLQLFIGSVPCFPLTLTYEHDFWDSHMRGLYGDSPTGDSYKSNEWSGTITRSMWQKAYGVYRLNLQHCEDIVSDSQLKNMQLTFNVVTQNLLFDIAIVIETESEFSIIPSTGELVQ